MWFILWVCAFFAVVFFMYSSADKGFQSDSEDLAVGPIYIATEGADIDMGNYGLGRIKFKKLPEKEVYNNVVLNGATLDNSYKYTPYRSQLGLQGMIYKVAAGLLSGILSFKVIYHGLRFACLFLFVLTLLLIVLQLKKRYGLMFAVVFAVVSVLSPWIQNFSVNLYWVEFTWFIPLLLSLLILNHYEKRFFIYPLFFISIFIKCLCGYEYLSTIMVTGIMFMLVEWIVHKEERGRLIKAILVIGVLSLLAFATAFVIHAYVYGSGNVGEGLKMLAAELVEKRTYGDAANFDDIEGESLNASVFTVLWKYMGFGTIHGMFMLFLFIATVFVLIMRSRWKRACPDETGPRSGLQLFMSSSQALADLGQKENNIFDISIFVVSLLSTLSWIVLAKGHSYVHTHINFVMFYMGWVQVSVYILVKTLIDKFGNAEKHG